MDKVQNPSNSECYTPTSESFTSYSFAILTSSTASGLNKLEYIQPPSVALELLVALQTNKEKSNFSWGEPHRQYCFKE
jgi:hypothetical protein